MVELFPNLDVLIVRVPCSLRSGISSFQPPRKVSFPSLKALYLHFSAFTPELDNNILSGFAQASMTLQLLSITGTLPT